MSNINSGGNKGQGPQSTTPKTGNSQYPASTQKIVQTTKGNVEKTLDK